MGMWGGAVFHMNYYWELIGNCFLACPLVLGAARVIIIRSCASRTSARLVLRIIKLAKPDIGFRIIRLLWALFAFSATLAPSLADEINRSVPTGWPST
jgi:hypothetical protein